MVGMLNTRASLLTDEITESNIAKSRFLTGFFNTLGEDFSSSGGRRSSVPLTPTQSSSGTIGVPVSSVQPGMMSLRPTAPPPKFVAPEFDEKRFTSIWRGLAAPGAARLSRDLRAGLLETRRDNPNLESKLREGLFRGYGDALAANQAMAQAGGFRQANAELGLKREEVMANFSAAVAERDRLQRQAFEAEQRGDERTFREAMFKLSEQSRNLADQQDFLQALEFQSIAFENQFVRDILASAPRATGTGALRNGKPVLTFKSPLTETSDKTDEGQNLKSFWDEIMGGSPSTLVPV